MKKFAVLLAAVALVAVAASAAVVAYDYAPATNGAAYTVPGAWTPATATAWGTSATVTVQRIHGNATNTLGTIAPGATNASLSWGSLVRGDRLLVTGTGGGTVEIQGTR